MVHSELYSRPIYLYVPYTTQLASTGRYSFQSLNSRRSWNSLFAKPAEIKTFPLIGQRRAREEIRSKSSYCNYWAYFKGIFFYSSIFLFAWEILISAWEHENLLKCVTLTLNAWELTALRLHMHMHFFLSEKISLLFRINNFKSPLSL